MIELTKRVQDEGPWCTIFADDGVSVNENTIMLEGKFETC